LVDNPTHRMNTHAGSCLCGAIAFEIAGSFESFYLCHCEHCRKDSGSAFAANLALVPRAHNIPEELLGGRQL
jgi:hypothetical protein